jgi:hypothetical protein
MKPTLNQHVKLKVIPKNKMRIFLKILINYLTIRSIMISFANKSGVYSMLQEKDNILSCMSSKFSIKSLQPKGHCKP